MAETWERFNEIQRSCPHHSIERWSLLQIFYGGLTPYDKAMLDAAAGGSLLNKGTDPGFKIIDDMAVNQSQWHNSRGQNTTSQAGVLELDAITKLAADLSMLNKKVDKLSSVNSVNSNPSCTNCGAPDHWTVDCKFGGGNQNEEVFALNQGNFRPNNPYSNTYNPGWRNHPNFYWNNPNDQNSSGPANQGFENQGNYQRYQYQQNFGTQGQSNEPPKSNIEKMLENFMLSQEQKFEKIEIEL